jgi:hypothetical protein
MDLNNIQKHIDQFMHEQNNRSIAEFEGYSPFEMHNLLNYTFDGNSPISFQKATKADYARVPMLNQMKYFLDLINKSGEIKLTAKGFLPTKLVKQIYDQEFLEEIIFYAYKPNVLKESDSMTVNLTRLLAELCGLTKKRNNKLSLTKTGERLLAEDNTLFELIFKTLTTKFNWAYYDAYGDNHIGQTGFGFSLILLHKYGKTKRQDTFYAEKYFKAFPDVFSTDSQMGFKISGNWANTCYSLRTFDRFLSYFGFIKIEEVGEKWKPDKFITKTDLFDKLIKVQPHKTINIRPN